MELELKSKKCMLMLIAISWVLSFGDCLGLIQIIDNENYFKHRLNGSSYERAIVVFENNNKYRSKNKELQLYARSAALMDAMNGRITVILYSLICIYCCFQKQQLLFRKKNHL
ncbi:MAG: hypothetical protein K5895_12755, partial [Lachnospiraceae bacterium]|nr:hypothetical protein [Lachnospiraceae bacterium]